MPRKARIDAPGALHHIMARGIERGKIFRDDDERILGDGDFVEQALGRINEQLDPAYDLSTQGYDFEKIVQRVAHLLDMPEAEVLSPSKRRAVVKARSMICYWVYKYLGTSQTDLARKYGISQPAVCAAGRCAERAKDCRGE